jgi:2-polyprenyl-6-methoxyphenol hydroxylase-like FAD-dependent oxidoreductase
MAPGTPTALIIGGGVAGLVGAMALQRAGIDATVHEASSSGAAAGAGGWLALAPNGLDALRAIGAEAPVLASGFPSFSVRLLSGRGAVLGTSPTTTARPDGGGSRVLLRSDLHGALRQEASDRGITVRFGSRLTQARTTLEGVVATFADGHTERAQLLVGADGVHSVVRRSLDPDARPLRPAKVLNVGARSRYAPPGARVGELNLVFGARALFGYALAPDGCTWWFANPPLDGAPGPGAHPGTAEAAGDERWRAYLRELYAADRSPALALLEATTEPLRAWPSEDLPRVRTWHDEHTVLIGDAVHASTPGAGQGASLALEDAVVLAQCLRDLPVPAALTRFERLRRRRVQRVVALAARTCEPSPTSPVALRVRDAVMHLTLSRATRGGKDSLEWIHRHHLDWDAPAGASVG